MSEMTDFGFHEVDPTDEDILAEEDESVMATDWFADEEDEPDYTDYSARDDRWDGNGVPSWSAYA